MGLKLPFTSNVFCQPLLYKYTNYVISMSKKSKDKKMPVRFLISEKKYYELKEKAKKLDVPLSSYIKMKIIEENDNP